MRPPTRWLDEAAALPVYFSLVREDPLLDREVLRLCGPRANVLLVASGGCTAALLAGCPDLARLHLVDPNPAQLALARLKLRLLRTGGPDERMALLGHASMDAARRQRVLAESLETMGLPADSLGPPEFVAEVGPDHAGRYERLFHHLREALRDRAGELEALLRLSDPNEQVRRAEPQTELGRALDEAYDDVLALPNLIRLFGEGATRNPVEPFARHFARRTRHVLATQPAADNPYLWLMLRGRLPDGAPLPWLSEPRAERMPEVVCSRGMMADVLAAEPGAYDFVHLSNILDWLSPDEARSTLEVAWRALRPGGRVLIRQLNSTLNIPALGGMFEWERETANAMLGRDRSFFYRALHRGRRA